jgi:hypothetical protein
MAPAKYTVEELEDKINDYFDMINNQEGKVNPPTLYDLSDYLEVDRTTLWRWAEGKTMQNSPGYATVAKRARNRILSWWVRQLGLPGRPTTGIIFYLKNVAGWADKQEVKHEHSGAIDHRPDLSQLPPQQAKALLEAVKNSKKDKDDVIDIEADD